MKSKISIVGIVCFLIVISCQLGEIKEINSVESSLEYSPEFALPIGEFELPVNELVSKLDFSSYDTIDVPDSLANILFENIRYENPITLDTLIRIPFQLSDISVNQPSIKELMLRVNVYNGLPFFIYMEILKNTNMFSITDYYVDGPDSLWVNPAPVDSDGRVTNYEKSSKNDYTFDSVGVERLSRLNSIDVYILIQTELDSTLPKVELDTNYGFKVQLGVKAKIKTELEY